MGIKKEIGRQIKELRIKNGYTQEKLSEMINISQKALSSIELGKNFITSETLDKILSIFDITAQEFFATDDCKDSNELLIRINRNMNKFADNPKKLAIIYNLTKSLIK